MKTIKKCYECEQTEKEIKKEGYDFKIIKCCHCKKYFCEACLIDDDGCPECSVLVSVY
jgi:hypothetical protein